MRLYRLSLSQYSRDLSGEGARLFGGRWNKKGSRVLYTSENSSLCILEKVVQMEAELHRSSLSLTTLELEKKPSAETLSLSDLPPGWRNFPSPEMLKEIGQRWIDENKSLLLSVPSAVNEHERNFLINVNHPHFSGVKLVEILPFEMDRRLLASKMG